MGSERLKALTDGVVAVIITIMVLELKPPQGVDLAAFAKLWPIFLSFVLSFTYVAIYWNNHHNFFNLVPRVSGAVMWANFNLLFWLSLVPFRTAWLSEHPLSDLPVALYGVSLLASAISWFIIPGLIVRMQGPASPLGRALGADLKGRLSPIIYVAGICAAFFSPLLSYLPYAAVAVAWLIPDRRMEIYRVPRRTTARLDLGLKGQPPRSTTEDGRGHIKNPAECARRGYQIDPGRGSAYSAAN